MSLKFQQNSWDLVLGHWITRVLYPTLKQQPDAKGWKVVIGQVMVTGPSLTPGEGSTPLFRYEE